ncbi:FG-GAP repeat domain-containing protein [Streptomyces carpinensis]|uniref:VCBS repeat-containing protein n=1 Tax=Streptomyces carpinensis TaxID=66369 RepID=A0ABV1W7Z6_9ACTN|nr:VCBS repeat-containing protein [Streptomyces carpinensis]
MRVTPDSGYVVSAGTSGFLHSATTTNGPSGLEWTGADGSTRKLEGTHLYDPVEYYGTASDVVALPPGGATGDVLLRNMVTDETTTVTVPKGQKYSRTIGTTVVTEGGGADGKWTEFHLLTDENGTTEDRRVTGLPEGAYVINVGRAGVHGFLSLLKVPGDDVAQYAWVDLRTAEATFLPYGTVYGNSVVTALHLVTPQAGGVRIYEQGRFDTPLREVQVSLTDAKVLGVVGDSLIVGRYDPSLGQKDYQASVWRVVAVPFDGSGERTLLARAVADRVAVRPDGGLQIVGGRSAQDYGYQDITAGADAVPHATRVLRILPVPMQLQRLTLDHGTVTTLEYGDRATFAYQRLLTETAPGYGERVRVGGLPAPYDKCSAGYGLCPELYPTGDGRTVYRGAVSVGGDWQPKLFVVGKGETFPGTPIETGLQDSFDESEAQTRIVGASESLVLVDGTPAGGGRELRVVDIHSGKVLHKEPYQTGAIWGTTLWSSTPGGTVTAKDARTGTSLTSFAVSTRCSSMVDLQAVGRWLYWKCNVSNAPDAAGVYDLQSRKSIPLPSAGQAHLGDGVVAVRAGQGLGVYGLQTGAAVQRWATDTAGLVALDPRNGDLAYSTPDQAVHVLNTGRPEAALVSPYRNVTARVETDATPLSWRGEWWLSEPAASWKVEIRHKATGRVVATRRGGPATYSIATTWDGRGTTGGLIPNGSYTWTLTAVPADGQGAAFVQSGTVRLTGGAAVWRDHVGGSSLPDGVGDLLTLNSSGALTFQQGDGAGKFSGKVSASGWSTSVRAVPLGDLSGDRCNDVLVRLSNGALRLYKPACGAALKPSTPYTTLGSSGWTQYDVLTAPGDVTKDGRPDLIARNASTGAVYLYKSTSTGKLSSRVKLYDSWKGYKKIVGAGDLNGDGIGDLLLQDKADNLYRLNGTGKGTFTSRVKIAGNWGGSYNAVVGVGDITGDGRADIVARDTAGNLYRQNGTGKGTFGSRTKIASGWAGYKGLF